MVGAGRLVAYGVALGVSLVKRLAEFFLLHSRAPLDLGITRSFEQFFLRLALLRLDSLRELLFGHRGATVDIHSPSLLEQLLLGDVLDAGAVLVRALLTRCPAATLPQVPTRFAAYSLSCGVPVQPTRECLLKIEIDHCRRVRKLTDRVRQERHLAEIRCVFLQLRDEPVDPLPQLRRYEFSYLLQSRHQDPPLGRVVPFPSPAQAPPQTDEIKGDVRTATATGSASLTIECQRQKGSKNGNSVGGTAVKALAGAAAGGAATYAVRKAVASRHGHDEAPHDEAASKHEDPEGSARDQEDDSEYAGNEDSAVDGDEDTKQSEDYDEQEDEPEESAEEDDDGYDDDDPQEPKGNGSRPRAGRSLRTFVNPSRLASASQLLLPLAEEIAASAGRYVGEHAPGTLREQILPRFIEAFEEAA